MPSRERLIGYGDYAGDGGSRGSSVADLIMANGRAQADAELRGGEAWQNATAGIAQALAGGLQAYKARKDDDLVQKAIAGSMSPRTKPTPGMDVNGDPVAETAPQNDMLARIQSLPPELRGRAMKGIQDWEEFSSKRQESDMRLQKLQQEMEETKRNRQQHDLDTVAVGAFHAKDWLDQPDGGLSAITLLSQQAKGAKIPGAEQYDEFLAGAQDAWQAAGNDPNAQATVAAAVREQAGPLLQRMMAAGSAGVQEKFAPKTREVEIQNADGSVTKKVIEDKPGQTFTGAPKPDSRSLEVQRAEALSRGDAPRAASLFKQLGENSAATRDPRSNREPLVAIMGPDGKPVLVPQSQAVGKRPASNREQGRPVTSGDAGRIAELDTALDEANTLVDKIGGNKATGVMAKVGTMVPNVVTEFTGWGSDAKQKEGTINLVKQIIGKGLEGGVLRKEDESKYAKILPTISDSQEVVAGKMEGLWKALQQKRQNHLDSLSDAGYDTAKFTERKPRERAVAGGGPKKLSRAEYEAAPSGTEFLAPDGQMRRKP